MTMYYGRGESLFQLDGTHSAIIIDYTILQLL